MSRWQRFLCWLAGEGYYTKRCPRCDGERALVGRVMRWDFRYHNEVVKCWYCSGRGWIMRREGT